MKKIMLLVLIILCCFLTGCDLFEKIICVHEYETEIVEPTCEQEGYTLNVCTLCGFKKKTDRVAKNAHTYTEWIVEKEQTDTTDGLKSRQCIVCGQKETEIISSINYIDMDIIKFKFNNPEGHIVKNYEELSLLFDCAMFNMVSSITCTVDYTINDLNSLISQLINDCCIKYPCSVGLSMIGNKLTINYSYKEVGYQTTSSTVYKQYNSLNYDEYNSTRTEDYDDFTINTSLYNYSVSTTEQLFYALERGVRPVCDINSEADLIYKKMKQVLIEIIDDNMNTYQKVKAIHDWLILNVTYDKQLLDLVYSDSSNVSSYNGFYLEGVFDDKKAVCEGISKAFACLANIEGIPCVLVEGYPSDNPYGAGHAWNKINIDGKWYIVDATSDGTIIGQHEILSYKYFLVSDDVMKQKYTAINYDNIICNNNYNYYTNYHFTYDNKQYDFSISSFEELKIILAYFYSNSNNDITIEFEIKYDYEGNLGSEINKALHSIGIAPLLTYTGDASNFTLIK